MPPYPWERNFLTDEFTETDGYLHLAGMRGNIGYPHPYVSPSLGSYLLQNLKAISTYWNVYTVQKADCV